jgi:hypothetical protein
MNAVFYQSVVTNGSVKIPPFDVRPSMLELMKGDTGVLEVVFAPHSIRKYTQEVTIVCDNCHVKHFTLKGTVSNHEVEGGGVEVHHQENVKVKHHKSARIPGILYYPFILTYL